MADVATVFMKPQIAPEVTPGTGVTVDTALQSIGIAPAIKANIKRFRPMGSKFNTISALGREWVEAGLTGVRDYNELEYLIASCLNKVSPVGAGTDKTWTHTILRSAPDTIATYTCEYGSTERASKFTYGLVTALTLAMSREGIDVSGSMLGQALQDDVAFTTSGITSPTQMPMLGTAFSAYLADTAAGLAGASELDVPFLATFNVGSRFGPIWAMKRTNTSFARHVETVPEVSLALKLEANDEGMGPLVNMRAGSKKFVRIQAIGPEISVGVPYLFQIDVCGTTGEPKAFEDVDGVYAIEWPFVATYDAIWTKALEVKLVNTLSAL